MKRKAILLGFIAACQFCGEIPAHARPPLSNDSTRTSPQEHLEIYSGFEYSNSGTSISREIPVTDIYYGFTDELEGNWSIPYLQTPAKTNFAAMNVGTKYRFNEESPVMPAVAASLDVHFPSTGDFAGIDQQTYQYNWRLRLQKSWDWFSTYLNGGYTLIDDFKNQFDNTENTNSFFGGWAQEWRVTSTTLLLSEVYFTTSQTLKGDNTGLVNVGFKQRLMSNISANASIGKSIRDDNKGGPELRFYAGLRAEFSFRKDSLPHWPD